MAEDRLREGARGFLGHDMQSDADFAPTLTVITSSFFTVTGAAVAAAEQAVRGTRCTWGTMPRATWAGAAAFLALQAA